MKIADHAVERYRERIRSIPEDGEAARAEMRRCLAAAKPKHIKRARANRKTQIIPTGCCYFICSYGTVVSVVKELRLQHAAAAEGASPEGVNPNQAIK